MTFGIGMRYEPDETFSANVFEPKNYIEYLDYGITVTEILKMFVKLIFGNYFTR